MKITKLFILSVISVISFNNLNAQKLNAEQKERENNKVNIFSSEEKDNLQQFYTDEVNKMKLSDEKREEYYNILLFHTYDMSRLDDKDKDYSENEINKKFNNILDTMNSKMKAFLTPEQYVLHLETFSKIIYSVNRKKSLKKDYKVD
jgi:hypothetical protein